MAEIGKFFGLASYASAGSMVRTLRLELERDTKLRKRVDALRLDVTA